MNFMKKWILYFLLVPTILQAQQSLHEGRRWLDKNLKATNVQPIELIDDFVKYDYSIIWLSNQESNIGFIGDNYQRFYIHFYSFTKNGASPSSYLAKGKSKVKNNICDFEGVIRILHIREINKRQREEMMETAKKHNDPDLIGRTKYRQYMILAEYELNENQNQKWAGKFKGFIKSYFYIKNKSIFYDDLNFGYSDSFSNNLFDGIWKMHGSKIEKKCCWGNYRIPNCGDLDIGAGEFSPNDKYLNYGWSNYYKAYIEGNTNALKEEQKKWW